MPLPTVRSPAPWSIAGVVSLIGPFLLCGGRQRWLRFSLLLIVSALLALSAALLLIGTAALLAERLLGTAWRSLVFPYVDPVLGWIAPGWPLPLAAASALLSSLALAVLAQGPAPRPPQRRWWMLAGLLWLLVVGTAVDVAFTEGNGTIMDALAHRSERDFLGSALGLIAVYLTSLPIQAGHSYGEQRWSLEWRNVCTSTLQEAYLNDLAYVRLHQPGDGRDSVDNPDQRIAQDVELAVSGATSLAFTFCSSLLTLAAYLAVLISISWWLVLALTLATLLGNGVILRMVKRLARIGSRQQELEADYRYALIHLRRHSEAVAFLRGEPVLAVDLGRRFLALLANSERLIRWRTLLNQSGGLYAFLMQFVPYLVLWRAYLASRLSLADLTVASLAFLQVQAALSLLIDRGEDVSSLLASLSRIGELDTALVGLARSPRQGGAAPRIATVRSQRHGRTARPGSALQLRGLTVAHPGGGAALIDRLDLELAPGQRLLVNGPSGCGKTALLRVICGLVPAAAGEVVSPPAASMLALPQEPFLVLGSLRDQLVFPGRTAPAPTDPELREILTLVGLEHLIGRLGSLDRQLEWARSLSGGDCQKIGFARALLHRPSLLLLDEVSSALDLMTEARLHALLVAMGSTLISVGHRPSLNAFHEQRLVLDGRGGWQIESILATAS